MKLKVCGMKYNTEEVAASQPDYLGFIFYEKSPRNFTGDLPGLTSSIKKVGVFVDADLDEILEKVKRYHLHAVQLHGKESPMYCTELKSHFRITGKPSPHFSRAIDSFQNENEIELIKVFSIKDEFDFSILTPYENVCDYFLFDTKGKLPGGNGYAFDWNVLQDYPSTKPYFLSGGIGLDEEQRLKEFLSSEVAEYCYAIDINSRFETKPGLKDIEKLKEFKDKFITRNEVSK